MQEIKIVVTMDCERPTADTDPVASGSPNFQMVEIWTRTYAKIAAEYGWPVTFFVHPETGCRAGGYVPRIESAGHCLGLHIHAWRFDLRFQCKFGGLSEAEARAMLSRAIEMWREAFNVPWRYFRRATLSANDPYSGSSPISVSGAAPSHCQGASFRTNTPSGSVRRSTRIGATPTSAFEGPLEFANMPISVDTSQLNEKDGRQFYWDLRPDFDGLDYLQMARNIVAQLREHDPAIPCINMLTHNDYDFADPSRVGRNYRDVLAAIKAACDEANIKQSATLGEIVDDGFKRTLCRARIRQVRRPRLL